MFENLVLSRVEPEDVIKEDVFSDIKSQFINVISENKLTISQTRFLFSSILEHFDRNMPVTNHTK